MTNFKIYTREAALEIQKAISAVNLKELKGDGTFEVIATVEVVDRDGEIVRVAGMDATNFMKNPVILWGHNYWDINAMIGKATEVIVQDDRVIVRGIFASTPYGQLAKQLYDEGILKTVSIGFIPKERNANIIESWELLELSFVSVPSNPDALSTDQKKYLSDFETMMKTALSAEPKETGHNNSQKRCPACNCEQVDDVKALPLTAQTIKALDECLTIMTALRASADVQKVAKQAEAADEAVASAQAMQKMLERVITSIKTVKS